MKPKIDPILTQRILEQVNYEDAWKENYERRLLEIKSEKTKVKWSVGVWNFYQMLINI